MGIVGKAWIQGPYFSNRSALLLFYENSKGEDEDEGKKLKGDRITSQMKRHLVGTLVKGGRMSGDVGVVGGVLITHQFAGVWLRTFPKVSFVFFVM